MPKNAEGYKQLGTWQPAALIERLEALCETTGRTIEAEVRHALERHLSAPPTIRTPELTPAEIEPTKKVRGKKKRGTT